MARAQVLDEPPGGLLYRRDALDVAEEAAALAAVERVEFRELTMRGQTARRTVRHFGFDYGYESWQLVPAEPIPEDLAWLRSRAADVAGLPPGALAQTLVTRYPAGATIGWHRDAPMFGVVVGVSLASACRMRFQRGSGAERRVFELELAPRSVYVLDGEIRSSWQHSIPATKDLRYSVTFRTLRNPERWAGGQP